MQLDGEFWATINSVTNGQQIMHLFGKKAGKSRIILETVGGKRYHELNDLGTGGLARITSAFDVHLNRVVAAKKLKENSVDNMHLVKAFINEAKLISYLDHPGVVPVYDIFVDEKGELCYTMKVLGGRSLCQFLEEEIDESQATERLVQSLEILSRICETMASVHNKGVLHLDLKPENIMLGGYGQVMIVDWGNAYLFNREEYENSLRRYTEKTDLARFESESNEFVLGTPTFMSPEQTQLTRDHLTPASDVFSVGTIFYQMLTGILPFDAPDANESMELVRLYEPRAPHEINGDVPKRLSQICMAMLCKERNERYRGFDEVLADLNEFRNAGITFLNRTFGTGEVIFREGDDGNYSLTVLSGRVEISKIVDGKPKVLAILGKGEVLGELAIISKQPRTASAKALEPTSARIMLRESIEQELEKLSPWVGKMVDSLCTRFIDLNDRLARLDEET